MKDDKLQKRTLLILLAVISLVFLFMVRSFLITLLMAAIFSTLARPVYNGFHRLTKGKSIVSAGLAMVVVFLVFVIPAVFVLGVAGNQAVKVSQAVRPWVQNLMRSETNFDDRLKKIPGYRHIEPYSKEIMAKIGVIVTEVGNFLISGLSSFTAGTVIFFFHMAIMFYAMFFFFLDGPKFLDRILYLLPLQHKDEKRLIHGFRSMARATIKGTLVIGLVQGSGAAAALWLAGIQNTLFWGIIMTILSIIPNVGTAIVWVPACIYLFLQGQTLAAVLVALWCGLVVGMVDNFLRPILIGADTQMHELMILVSTLGGIMLFGLPGFILGPILASLFVTIWDIYGITFKDSLPPVGNL